MRALSTSVLVSSMLSSSIALGICLTAAKAQTVNPDAPPALNSSPSSQDEDASNLTPGVLPQPSTSFPGLVLGVKLGELYTDNLTLAPSGSPKQSAWITEVQPFIRAARSGPRFSGVVDYSLTGYLYAGHSNNNQLAQNLDASGTLTILPQHLFLDGSARYGREIINNQLPAGTGSFFLANNRANVAVGSLSPYWLQDLGNVGTMTLRYTYGRVVYNNRGIPGENSNQLNGIPDVTSNAVQFSLVSPEYQRLGWSADYSEQRLTSDFGRSIDFATAKVGASYEVNYGFRLLADAGKETRFLPDGTTQKLGAPFWDAGFEWAGSRDKLTATVGHRFFGRSYNLSWTHEAALLTTNVSYVEQPTTYNQQLLGLNAGIGALPPISIGPFIPSLTELQPYLSKRLSASATYSMPSSTLTARVYDESRTYFTQNSLRERVADADVSWLFDVGARTTLTPSFTWQRYQFRSGQISYTRYAQLALVHQLNPKNFGSLRLRRDDATVYSASPGAHGYTANVIFVEWTHLF